MKTSEFLKIVKRDYLATCYKDYRKNHKHRYLCCAIVEARKSNDFRAAYILSRINKALGIYNTAEGWLLEQGHASVSAVRSGNAMYEYRHRWVDSLIEEYETKGD